MNSFFSLLISSISKSPSKPKSVLQTTNQPAWVTASLATNASPKTTIHHRQYFPTHFRQHQPTTYTLLPPDHLTTPTPTTTPLPTPINTNPTPPPPHQKHTTYTPTPLGPIHRAAQRENITLRHVPGGCYRHGRCERLHHRSTLRELRQRGVDPRGLSIRQALRVARGYPAGLRADGDGDGDQDGGGRRGLGQGNLGQGVLGIGDGGEWGCGRGRGSGRMRGRAVGGSEMGGGGQRWRTVGGSEMGGGFASGMGVPSGSRGAIGGGDRAPRGGTGAQRGGRRADYEYAGSGGGRGSVWENDDNEYDERYPYSVN